jgi:hypothetical protein
MNLSKSSIKGQANNKQFNDEKFYLLFVHYKDRICAVAA